jgi:phosphohistidine swiveling domain-containing protein
VWLFERYRQSFARFVSLRENLKFEVITFFGHLRNEYLLLGKALFEKGILSSTEQIFLLKPEEIQACVKGDVTILQSLPELLVSRKADQVSCEELQPPTLFSRIGEQIIPLEGISSTGEEALKGIPCCRGVVSAPAYLLQSLDGHLEHIPPGSILVAPSIDPGLTPLFVNAVGLVTEIGGMLSHGATLAREFGLPTVVGVPHIMDKVSNQQIITVDGYRGLVFLSPPDGRDEK